MSEGARAPMMEMTDTGAAHRRTWTMLLVLIALVVIAIGAWWFFANQRSATPSQPLRPVTAGEVKSLTATKTSASSTPLKSKQLKLLTSSSNVNVKPLSPANVNNLTAAK